MDDIPEWAVQKANKLSGHAEMACIARDTFARYIAAHEGVPVDPLVEEAQKIADDFRRNLSAMPWLEDVLTAALRRGIEIAGGGNG